ncbi:hypothetical protein POM88_049405 [Heracleum sosnowskyi]|uniref:Uncharacterized protein n=1 Tax=Heracleum sosnowskyi TaxID=360622 RepID=A0AAD8M1D3_9APIA|nr:hypothetical protein POM88_049405 [Heracleum sosnowskyi]
MTKEKYPHPSPLFSSTTAATRAPPSSGRRVRAVSGRRCSSPAVSVQLLPATAVTTPPVPCEFDLEVLFPSSSRNLVHPRYIQFIQKSSEISSYAWGAAPLAISQKRPREIETTDSPTSPTHDVSYKRPRQVESTDDPVIQQNPVVDPPLVHVEVGDSAPSPSQQDSERSPPPVVEVTTIPPVTQPSPTTPVATIPPVTQPSPAPPSLTTPSLTTPVTWWQCPTPPEVASTVGPVAASVRLSGLLGMFSNEDQFKDMERRRHKPKAVKEIKDLAMHPSCRTPEDMVGLKRSHWILFVVDIKRMKVNLLDPLRDESNCNLRVVYSTEFYVMEKIIPCLG